MEIIENEILDNMKRKDLKVVSEKPLFKHNFMRYVVKKMSDKTLEFWCYPTESEDGYYVRRGRRKIVDHKPYYLGRWNGEKLVKNKKLYTHFYYEFERNLTRVMKMLGLYEEF